jgi:hypothetical protein
MISLSPLSSSIIVPYQIFTNVALHNSSYDTPIMTSLTSYHPMIEKDTDMQWWTLTVIVGGAKRYYIRVEGANSNYFVFCMVKNNKY